MTQVANAVKKYSVTQEEITRALEQLRETSSPLPPSLEEQETTTHAWNLNPNGTEHVGIHIRSAQTFVIGLTKKLEIRDRFVLRAGYDQPDKLQAELLSLSGKLGGHLSAAITLSGKHSPFLLARAPQINTSMVAKALKIQLKAASTEEFDEVSFMKLPVGDEEGSKVQELITCAITAPILERTVDLLRKARFRLHAWDTDILCYARAASFLWQFHQLKDSTRFVVVIGANKCRLILMGRNGKLITQMIPMGIASFLEHLTSVTGDPSLNTAGIEEQKLVIRKEDTVQTVIQKASANQAIFSLYVPFAQQIHMGMYKACSDNGLALPKHFVVLGPGARLLRIGENLETDLGLKALQCPKPLEPEMAAALGAALWDRHPVRLNLLPARGGEWLHQLKDLLQIVRDKVGKIAPQGTAEKLRSFSWGNQSVGRILSLVAVLLILSVGYPVWNRWRVSRELDAKKKTLELMGRQREEVQEFSKRQALLDKKLLFRKSLQAKKIKASPIFKDVLYHLPPAIRLNAISLKENGLVLKGVAKSQPDLESFLELCTKLQFVGDPNPLSIRRQAGNVGFEIAMKVKPQEKAE